MKLIATIALSITLCAATIAHSENWPNWRGPHQSSVSGEEDLPIAWSEFSGLAWKTQLPAWGNSTPAIWEDAIFLTSHRGEDLLLLRLDTKKGQIVWTQKVGAGEATRQAKRGKQKFHQLHNLASPSPVTDGETVVCHFGNGDLAAYDFEGNQLWKRNLQDDFGDYTIWWGHANSPVRFEDSVISVCMQDPMNAKGERGEPGDNREAKSYLVAHDLKTGRQKWLTLRHTRASAEQGDAYTTPLRYETSEGPRLLVWGANQLDVYDPRTGEQLWYLPDLVGGRTVTGPTIGNDMVYVTQGMRGPLLGVALEGESGERDRDAIAWRYTQGTPDSCSPVVWEDLLFTVTDDGIVRCFDALTGNLHWRERIKGKYKASPVAADGRIYFLNTEGLCTVISAWKRYDRLTENKLDDTTLASPAISDGRIYIRGQNALYAIQR